MNISDPFSLLPKEAHGSAEVLTAAVVFLRARDNASWIELAEQARPKFPNDRHLSRFAAEAVIEPALADREVMFGKRADPESFKRVLESAGKLRELWRREMDMEDVREDPSRTMPLEASATRETMRVPRRYSIKRSKK